MRRLRALGVALASVLAATGAGADETPLGVAAAPIEAPRTSIALGAGTALRTRPTLSAPVVTILDEAASGELVEERDGWRRVRIGPVTGWLAPDGGAASGRRETDRARLTRSLALLPGGSVRVLAAGVALDASADERERLLRWTRVAEGAVVSWPGRLGVEPVALDGAEVVFAPGVPVPDGAEISPDPPEAPGSAGGGVALVHLGGRTDDQVEALLVHELSHLSSERTFATPLPLWLEEGIAEWLAREPLGSDGYSLQGALRGEIAVTDEPGGRRLELSGPLADLSRLALAAEQDSLPALDSWTALPAFELSSETERATRYALAGSFARFLFEADPERAASLRRALAAAALGEVDLDLELARRLGDSAELDRDFRAWLVAERDRQLELALPRGDDSARE